METLRAYFAAAQQAAPACGVISTDAAAVARSSQVEPMDP